MYKLAVGALFKNESHIIKEWIEHYLARGVEHFYLIDDNSTDGFMSEIAPYMNRITLFTANWTYYLGRQKDMYNRFILPHIKETQWLLMVDMDEFMWAATKDLTQVLEGCRGLSQIQVQCTFFGSNGHITQPPSVVKYFTKRQGILNDGSRKYFINTDYEFTALYIHHAECTNKEKGHFLLLDHLFRMNHYSCQSLEFWKNNKCKRGDSDDYRVRTEADFAALDLNEVEDLGLIESI